MFVDASALTAIPTDESDARQLLARLQKADRALPRRWRFGRW